MASIIVREVGSSWPKSVTISWWVATAMRSATKSSRIISASEVPALYSVWLAGAANGARLRRWIRAKKGDWYAVLEAPRMAVTSTLLDQAHNVSKNSQDNSNTQKDPFDICGWGYVLH